MRMIRSFQSVGQGAFYCEKFREYSSDEDLNVIYDCGSLTDKLIVEREIRNNFNKGETIQAVFLSHLDEDHINGIPFLLKYCNVKKIYFPLITEENRQFMKLYCLKEYGSGFTYNFIDNPNQAIRTLEIEGRPALIPVKEYGQATDDFLNEQGIDSGSNVLDQIAPDGQSPFFDYIDWLYIPYNFRQNDRTQQLKDALIKEFGKEMSNEDLLDIWKSHKRTECEKIKKAYKTVKGSFNTNSMTLFSGEINRKFDQYIGKENQCIRHCSFCYQRTSGCLYTGDYDASGKQKWEMLKKAYSEFWNHIGCVQIPHHGSRHNFNTALLNMNAFFVISAGNANKFRHPHSMVIKEMLMQGCIPYVITENNESSVFIVID